MTDPVRLERVRRPTSPTSSTRTSRTNGSSAPASWRCGFFAQAPRALFFPDGLLVAHGGFPLADLHARLAETGDWNDPACLADFVWTRAHPTARRSCPNRFSRGSQFGYEDFAAFCALAARLGRPVTHMVRGHDHVEERYAVYPAYAPHPVLTTVALSRRLPRESFGPPRARADDGALRRRRPAAGLPAAHPGRAHRASSIRSAGRAGGRALDAEEAPA